jgi:tetratricopeptide (TPR) repeat protein
MKVGKFLLAATVAAMAIPASAAVTVLGNSSARLCFQAAESGSIVGNGMGYCDQALREENLSTHDRVATHVNRGILKLRQDNLDAAILDFDQAIEQNPDEAEAYLNKGMAVLRGSDTAGAVTLFDAAIAKKTRKPAIAYFGRAVANELGGDIKAAYHDYRRASRIEPKWSLPRTELTRFTVREQ